jgi:biopolymer transport protein ExbD
MKKFDQINVIPFIDIMLVLLAIVLTTATFIAQDNIRVNLPQAKHSKQQQTEHPAITITLDNQLNLFIDGKSIEEVNLDKTLKSLNKDQAIALKIDTEVPFNQFVSILDLLKKYQLTNLSILTEPTP